MRPNISVIAIQIASVGSARANAAGINCRSASQWPMAVEAMPWLSSAAVIKNAAATSTVTLATISQPSLLFCVSSDIRFNAFRMPKLRNIFSTLITQSQNFVEDVVYLKKCCNFAEQTAEAEVPVRDETRRGAQT